MPMISTQISLKRKPRWLSHRPRNQVFETFTTRIPPGIRYVDVVLSLSMAWEATKSYEYSKLYYRTAGQRHFSEEQVICFLVELAGEQQRIRLELPASVVCASRIQLRLVPFPYTTGASADISSLTVLYGCDGNTQLTRKAHLRARKQWVRERVIACERTGDVHIDHPPESICLEITPRCNLTCAHCATHGTPEAHKSHNAMAEIPLDFIDHLATSVFPDLTSVTAIGRGEPLYLEDRTWDHLLRALAENDVFFSVVTNGILIKKRITPDVVRRLDTLTVSIDGLSQDTFGENRGGASIEKVLGNIRHFHEMRKSLNLPRRPKLCLSWTMKKNNIEEILPFLERVSEFEPDIMFTRHLMVFHDYDVEQSLLHSAESSNPILERLYRRMKELGIKTECPPISSELIAGGPEATAPTSRDIIASDVTTYDPHTPGTIYSSQPLSADPCMFVYRTANVHTDGLIHACPRPNAPYVGNFHEKPFLDIWHGEGYQRVRARLDTEGEMEECKYCWYRESKYHPQRFSRDNRNQQDFSVFEPVPYMQRTWDFRKRYVNLP